jgi:hypothetical protein
MPTIAYIKWPETSQDYGWLFKLASVSDFLEYWEEVRAPRLKEGFSNYTHSREYDELTGKENGFRNHLTQDDAIFIHAKAIREAMEDKPRSIVDVFSEGCTEVQKGMLHVLEEKGTLYVNGQGGYFFLSPGMMEIDTQKVGTWVLPTDKIRTRQWPNGEHWYAYVGSASVVLDGINKWGTKEEAREAAEKWIESSGQTPDNVVDWL